MDKNFTFNEIKSQAKSWQLIFDDIDTGTYEIFKGEYDKIVLFGCGSSYNLAMSAAFFTNTYTDFDALAVPSSELVLNTDTYIKKGKKYLLVGFSRSGETTETIEVINKIKPNKNTSSFVFSCRNKNTLITLSNCFFICRGSEEESIVMTRSFSGMLLAYVLMVLKHIKSSVVFNEFRSMFEYVDEKMDYIFENLENYISKNNFESYVSMGNGFNYGLAVEADLKMKEMSQTPSFSYHIFEFNHGPKSLLNERSLCLFLTIDNNHLDGLATIIGEILKPGSKIMAIGKELDNHKNIQCILTDIQFSNLIKSFINIPVFQILAYHKTIKKGLNPDKPRNLAYTTKI